MINSIIIALVSTYVTALSIKKGYVNPDTIINTPKKVKELYKQYKSKQKPKDIKDNKPKASKVKVSKKNK